MDKAERDKLREQESKEHRWCPDHDKLAALLDALDALDAKDEALARRDFALRHIAATADTLSPQEFINVCTDALGVDRHEYAGECDPSRSLVEQRMYLRQKDEALAQARAERDALRARVEKLRAAILDGAPGGTETCRAMSAWRKWWSNLGAPALVETSDEALAADDKEADRG